MSTAEIGHSMSGKPALLALAMLPLAIGAQIVALWVLGQLGQQPPERTVVLKTQVVEVPKPVILQAPLPPLVALEIQTPPAPIQAQTPPPPIEEVVVEPPAESDALLGPDWVKARDPRHFTIQLQLGANLSSFEKFARANPLSEPYAYYRTQSDGQVRYGLVVGDYPDQRTAREAAKRLEKLALGRPWIRSFGVLQGLLK